MLCTGAFFFPINLTDYLFSEGFISVQSQALELPSHCPCGKSFTFTVEHTSEFYYCFSTVEFTKRSLMMIIQDSGP